LIAEGDKVVARWSAQGTHQGTFMGIPPTNNQVQFSGIEIIRVVSDKAVEEWEELDRLGLMAQLGVPTDLACVKQNSNFCLEQYRLVMFDG
jgi:predicted ester cyclase